jgi:hypothetical protein
MEEHFPNAKRKVIPLRKIDPELGDVMPATWLQYKEVMGKRATQQYNISSDAVTVKKPNKIQKKNKAESDLDEEKAAKLVKTLKY